MVKSLLRTNKEIMEIYTRHVNTVYHVCFTLLKNPADTEDAVQNTFIKLLTFDKRFENTEHEKAWLIVTAGNICKNYLRHWWQRTQPLENCKGSLTEMQPEIQVRISINPKNGRLTGCNIFYFPLLDDHEEGDVPLTKIEAEQIARQMINRLWPGNNYELVSAEIVVALPNWRFTEYEDLDLRYSDVTRLAWKLAYKNPDSEVTDQFYMDVDLYTGEILGGDATW